MTKLQCKSHLQVRREPNPDTNSFYPGVTRGPLDITKAMTKLNFKPTPLHNALVSTFKWFDKNYEDNEELKLTSIREWLIEIFNMASSDDVFDFDSSDDDEYNENFFDDAIIELFIERIVNDIVDDGKDEL